jgi:hypothetical protein
MKLHSRVGNIFIGPIAKFITRIQLNKEEIKRTVICYLIPLSGNITKEKSLY